MASTVPTRSIKVLMVDDREENLIALEAALGYQGYELISALSGPEALRKVKEHDFAVILLDVQMPGMDGYETAERIRREPRSTATPIIFVTAINRTREQEHRGYGAGAVDYIFKPIDTEILQAKVSIFVELYEKNLEIQRQAVLLKDKEMRERENDWLKKALELRDEFISIAAHELKTPITPLTLQLQSFLQMMDEGTFFQADPERLKRMLSTSNAQVLRLARIIDDLLDISRISSGALLLQRGEIDLSELVETVITGYAPSLKKAGCEIQTKLHKSLRGYWDGSRLEQVVINLLTNAIKYGAGKPITVETEALEKEVVLRVRDEGIGISQMDQKRIFDRFERAVSARHYGGLGLGLYISNQIAALHQGRICVHSELGKGACFEVYLPHTPVPSR